MTSPSLPTPGIRPELPWVPNRWVDGEQVSDVKLSRRFTEPMNELRDYIEPSGQALARFFAYNTAATAFAAGSTISGWTVVEDTANWFDGTDTYSIPGFHGGLFLISCGLVSGVASQVVDLTINDLGLGAHSPSTGAVRNGAYVHTIRRMQQDADLQMITNLAITLASGFYTFFTVTELAFDYTTFG